MLKNKDRSGESHEIEKNRTIPCKRCGSVAFFKSKAFQNQWKMYEDFIGDENDERGRTKSRTGEAKLIDVLKCSSCGYSVSS